MAIAIAKARKAGVALVALKHAHHLGRIGDWAEACAAEGCASIHFVNVVHAGGLVAPWGGRERRMSTNPFCCAMPIEGREPIVLDFATSKVAEGKVQVARNKGVDLPPGCVVDGEGKPSLDPNDLYGPPPGALAPFGDHKGYGLSLINEVVGGFIGGSLPTIRNRAAVPGEKQGCTFFFQVIHPDAVSGGAFAGGRSQAANVKAVLADILGHGNEQCMLPGQLEAEAAARSDRAGGLLFSRAEIDALNEIAREAGEASIAIDTLKTV